MKGNFQPSDEYDAENFRKVLDVDVFGVYLVLQASSRAMLADKRGGVIVNTASLAGLQGPPNMLAYSAAKHAVIGMTRTASKDLAGKGESDGWALGVCLFVCLLIGWFSIKFCRKPFGLHKKVVFCILGVVSQQCKCTMLTTSFKQYGCIKWFSVGKISAVQSNLL